MPVYGYSAPIVQAYGQGSPSNIPEGAGYDSSGNPYMTIGTGQRVSVPIRFGRPVWNDAYNIYGNPAAAQARNQYLSQGSVGNAANQVIGGSGTTLPGLPTSASPSGGTPLGLGLTGGTTSPGTSTSTTGSNTAGGTRSAADTSGATGSFGTGPYSPGASPNLESISQLVNQINLNAQQQANAGRVPGGQAVENQLMQNTAQLAQGQLPADVIAQIQQQAAERGISTGNNDYLKALGLNSLQAQQTAQGNLSAAYARNPAAPIFDPTTQLLTPYQTGILNNQLGISNAELALKWWEALHPELRGGGGGGGGGGGRTAPSPTDSTSALPSWFPTLGGTPSSSSVTPPSLSSIPEDPFYTQLDYPGYSNPAMTTFDPGGELNLGAEDPFYLYGG